VEDNLQNPAPQQCIVGLRFQPIGKIYHFDASNFKDVQPGDYVVVETSRGSQLGQIVQFVKTTDRSTTPGLKSIMRIATPQDLLVSGESVRTTINGCKNCIC
jgi:cell fate regulator YaaT (PSP1 superfamily)